MAFLLLLPQGTHQTAGDNKQMISAMCHIIFVVLFCLLGLSLGNYLYFISNPCCPVRVN
jgi:hypothetical protein